VSERLDLQRRRDFGDLMSTTLSVLTGHLAVFTSLTLLVVAPAGLLLDGVWGRTLADGPDADPSTEATLVSNLVGVFVIPPLVTALHVVVVQGLARGEEPTVGAALRSAAGRLAPAVATVALYVLVVALGLIALIVPGIWLAVRCFFGAQAAVIDGLAPPAALRFSAELVRESWWRTFGLLLGSTFVFGVLAAVVAIVPAAIAAAADSGAVYVVTLILAQSVVLSGGAIFGTLLFFDLRGRRGVPVAQ